MLDVPLYLHVGLPKTATSALQQLYFSEHPEIRYLAAARKRGPPDPEGHFRSFVRWIRTARNLTCDRDKHYGYLRDLLSQPNTGERCRLISEERFTGHLGAGWRQKAQIAHQFFPSAKIIIAIRRPAELLLSNYLQHLRHPRPDQSPIDSFDQWVEKTLKNAERPSSYANAIRIHDIVECYEQLFGKDRVHVFLYEAFREDPASVLGELADWLGVDEGPFLEQYRKEHREVNRSPTRPEYLVWLLRQRWLDRGGAVPGSILGKVATRALGKVAALAAKIPWRPAVHLSQQTRDRIDSFAADQCMRMAPDRRLDLERYGYPVYPVSDRG